MERAGGRCIFASEIDGQAQETYAANFGGDVPHGDVTEIHSEQVPHHDLLTAGFPCQSFSQAGTERGLDSSTGQLFFEIPRILAVRQPAAFLLENVPNLAEHDGAATLESLRQELEACGYEVYDRVLQATRWLPQQRRRLFLIGFRRGLKREEFEWPRDDLEPGEEAPTLSSALGSLTPEQILAHKLSPEQWAKVRDHQTSRESPLERRLARLQGVARTLFSNYRKAFLLYSEFVPLEGQSEPRFYTAREVARLQGFPESFQLDANGADRLGRIYHQLGNAVCPPVIESVAKAIVATGVFEAPQPVAPVVDPKTRSVATAQQQHAASNGILVEPASATSETLVPNNPTREDGRPIAEPADQLLPAGRHGSASGFKVSPT